MNESTFEHYQSAYESLIRLGLENPSKRELNRLGAVLTAEQTQYPGNLDLSELLITAQRAVNRSLSRLAQARAYKSLARHLRPYRKIISQTQSGAELEAACQQVLVMVNSHQIMNKGSSAQEPPENV